jgi:Holliday junction resolvase RusA-like endonuclease
MGKVYVVEGEPVPWKAHKGFGKNSYSPNCDRKNVMRWDLRVQQEDAAVLTKPVRLEFIFYMPLPKGAKKSLVDQVQSGEVVYHDKRPDCTNLIKFAEDCLIGVVIKDDNQVVQTQAKKLYSMEPRTVIEVEEI